MRERRKVKEIRGKNMEEKEVKGSLESGGRKVERKKERRIVGMEDRS